MSGLVGFLNNPVRIVAGADAPGAKEWTFDKSGNIVLPQGGNILNYSGVSVLSALDTGNITFDANTISNEYIDTDVNIQTISTTYGNLNWNFSPDGKLTLPNTGQIIQNFSITKTTTADIVDPTTPTVIWSSDTIYTSTTKLLILLEQDPGDSTPDNTQSCEAIISAKGSDGIANDVPIMSVYGVTYTGASVLGTFTVQRNATTKLIEVVATLNNTTDPAFLRIYSVELMSRG